MMLLVIVSLVVLLTCIICNGLLWRYFLQRRPGAAKFTAWIAFGLGCMALVVVIFAASTLGSKEEDKYTDPPPCIDVDYEELVGEHDDYDSTGTQNKSLHNRCPFTVVPRNEWIKGPSKSKGQIKHPAEFVAISNTYTGACLVRAECTLVIRILQVFHTEGFRWSDVGYNFFIGGDGHAYEGRGWNIVGAHAAGLNETGVGISFVGTFTNQAPPSNQIRACKRLIQEGIRLGKISSNYKLIALGHNSGQKLLDELHTWVHWFEGV